MTVKLHQIKKPTLAYQLLKLCSLFERLGDGRDEGFPVVKPSVKVSDVLNARGADVHVWLRQEG